MGLTKFKFVSFITIAALLVGGLSGCGSRQKKTDETVEAAPMADGVGSGGGVDSAPMSFDAAGSDSGRIDGLSTVFFDYDRSNLTSEAKKKILANVDWMKKNTAVKVQIEGHCDSRGSIEYNIALGERRANAVKNQMISLGIASDRVSTISFGKEKPLVQGDDESAHSKNRRANFVPLN